jgi:CBS domain-containing protein
MKTVVRDLMTVPARAVGPDAGFKEMVEVMDRHGISALPVVDEQRHVLGVVSEADLLLKEERAELQEAHLFESGSRRTARAKAEAGQAGELMTSPAVTATENMPLREAARLLHEEGIKRLPVVDAERRLVGIISRADLLRVFTLTDEELRHEIVHDVIVGHLWMDPDPIRVEVEEGMVHLSGEVDRRTDVSILAALAGAVQGVVGVKAERLKYRYDDTRIGRPR